MSMPNQNLEEDKKGKIFVPRYDDKEKVWKLTLHDDHFEMPENLYGDVVEYTECVKINFHDYKKQTGCLFLGGSGTGKTLQAKHICNALMNIGYDVMYIYGSLANETIVTYLNETTFLGVIYIDEAAKVITGRQTNGLDGLLSTMSDPKYHRCWILTENKTWRLPDDMLNRPGRFLFKRTYGRVTEDIIRKACKDFGAGEGLADELTERNAYCLDFTLDTLICLLETHIKFPNLTLDDFTEKFSFESLRVDFTFSDAKVFYDDIDVTHEAMRSLDDEVEDSKDFPKGLRLSPSVRTDLLDGLNLKVIDEIMKKAKPFYVGLSGNFNIDKYETWVKGEYIEHQQPKDHDIPPPPPYAQQGNPNDYFTRGGMRSQMPQQPPMVFGAKFDKETQERLDKIKTPHGYKVNVYDVYNNKDEKKLICVLSKRLRLELSYDVSPGGNSYSRR